NDALTLSVIDILAGGLRGEPTFGERAGREGVRRAADRVTGAEQAFNRRHTVITPEILGRRDILATRAPGAGAGRVRAHDVGLGRPQLRVLIPGFHVRGGLEDRLPDGYAEKVFPTNLFQMRVLESSHGHHVNGAAACIHFTDDAVVA